MDPSPQSGRCPRNPGSFNRAESEFYQDLFNRATARVPSSDALMKAAIDEGSRTGISGLDAVHVACAVAGEAAELITSEKSTKPIHRTSAVTLVSINPQPPTTPHHLQGGVEGGGRTFQSATVWTRIIPSDIYVQFT